METRSYRKRSHTRTIRYIAVTLLVALIIALHTLSSSRIRAREAIFSEQARGLRVEWDYSVSAMSRISPSSRLWDWIPGVSPRGCYISYQMGSPERLGAAIAYFGTVRELAIDQGTQGELNSLLAALGSQPYLEELWCFNVPANDLTVEFLIKFPNLKKLAIVGSEVTGKTFPSLDKLESADFAYSPITDDGFEHLLECNSLQHLNLDESCVTEVGLETLKTSGMSLVKVDVSGVQLSFEEVSVIESKIKKCRPLRDLSIVERNL